MHAVVTATICSRRRSFRDDVSRRLVTLLNAKGAVDSIPAKCRHHALRANRGVNVRTEDIRTNYDFSNRSDM